MKWKEVGMLYKVIMYPPGEKKNVATEFYLAQPKSVRNKILRQIYYLGIYGLRSEVTNTKKLRGYDLWEVRILGKDNIRLFAIDYQNTIYIVHIFRKKSQNTPIKEIKIALTRIKLLSS